MARFAEVTCLSDTICFCSNKHPMGMHHILISSGTQFRNAQAFRRRRRKWRWPKTFRLILVFSIKFLPLYYKHWKCVFSHCLSHDFLCRNCGCRVWGPNREWLWRGGETLSAVHRSSWWLLSCWHYREARHVLGRKPQWSAFVFRAPESPITVRTSSILLTSMRYFFPWEAGGELTGHAARPMYLCILSSG